MALASFGKPRVRRRVPRRSSSSAATAVHDRAAAPRRAVRPAARAGAGRWTQRHFDIAHSLQVVLEETVLELAAGCTSAPGCDESLHGRRRRAELRDERPPARPRPVRRSLGPARRRRRRHRARRGALDRLPRARDAATAAARGAWTTPISAPATPTTRSKPFLRWSKLPYRRLDDIADETADLLAQNRVIGWFQGRMEFGPRALGARSILASPIDPRDAGAAQRDQGPRGLPPGRARRAGGGCGRLVRRRARRRRSCCSSTTCGRTKADRIPAVAPHRRHGARADRQSRAASALLRLIAAFNARTGVPVLVNTSFNTRGEPIVCTRATRSNRSGPRRSMPW